MQVSYKANTFLIETKAQIAVQERMAARAAKGNKEALAQLCEQIAESVLFRMSRMLRNHGDAEDAAQEALFRVCRGIKKLKNPKTFRKWLGTIVMNEARRKSMQNAKMFDNIIHLSEITEVAIDEDESFLPEKFAMIAENRKVVMEAISRLPQRQKEAVILHFYDRLNVTETAEVMGISQPAASIHLKEARSRIKRDIEASTDKLISTMHGFAVISFSDMLSRSLYMEGATFIPGNQVWLTETIAKCGEVTVAGAAAGGALGMTSACKAVSGKGFSSSLNSILKAVLTTAAATATTIALTFGVINWQSALQSKQAHTNATGGVIFTSNNEVSFINPTGASAISDSRHGELRVNHWEILALGSNVLLITGVSNTVDVTVFNEIRESGYLGECELVFYMEDLYGTKYELAHTFFILDEEK